MKNIITYITKLLTKLTNFGGNPKISQTRELTPSSIRELKCPYCFSANYKKRGFRQKKLEQVQLYQCLDCRKTFTRQITKGKHYPLPVMLDAISLYNLGYSLEQVCRIVNERQQKTTLTSGSLASIHADVVVPDLSPNSILQENNFVKSFNEDDYDYLLCPISDVLAGDEVMSLNEGQWDRLSKDQDNTGSGTLEYSRINRLIDMGLKEVYEVTLKSGRTIKTTSEHPFLTLI